MDGVLLGLAEDFPVAYLVRQHVVLVLGISGKQVFEVEIRGCRCLVGAVHVVDVIVQDRKEAGGHLVIVRYPKYRYRHDLHRLVKVVCKPGRGASLGVLDCGRELPREAADIPIQPGDVPGSPWG